MNHPQPYQIERISSDFVLVLSTTYEVLDYLGELEEELLGSGFRGTLLLDLLARNGSADNRFAQWEFGQTGLKRNSLKAMSALEVDEAVLQVSSMFYGRNQFLLEINYVNLSEEDECRILKEARSLVCQ